MNKQRRKSIDRLIDKLSEIRDEIEMLKDEEQEAFDNMPESLQSSERGENMETAIYALDEAYESIDSAIDSLTQSTEV